MQFFQFHATRGSKVAITDERSGAKLPPLQEATWSFVKTIEFGPNDHVSGGGDPQEIIAAVEDQGYYLWPLQKPKDE